MTFNARRIAAIGLLLTLLSGAGVAAARLLSPRPRPVEPPASLAEQRAVSPLAALTPDIDLGTVYKSELETRFTLENRGSKPLHIKEIGKSCLCMDPNLSANTLAPGARAELRLGLRIIPKDRGTITTFRERLFIHHDGCDRPLELNAFGRMIPPVYYYSPRINISGPPVVGGSFQGQIELFLNDAMGVSVQEGPEGYGAGRIRWR
jgi:hypothetical protein